MLTPKHKKRLKFLFIKIPIFIGIFCLIMIAALKLVERYPDPLKEGFENYLSDLTATDTTIGILNKAAFYPNVDIRVEDMKMHRGDNAAIIDMEADIVNVSVPLSGIFIRQGKLNLLNIKNFKSAPNFLTPAELLIKSAEIVEKTGPEQYGAFVVASGLYGQKEFLLEVEIQKGKKYYIIPDSVSFSLSLGEYQLNAATSQKNGNILLTNTTFEKGDKKSSIKEYIFIENNLYNKDNPLVCLYENAGNTIQECDQYLE